jgi:hypothetical protein
MTSSQATPPPKPVAKEQKFKAPWPGTHYMPPWDTGLLSDAPRFHWRKILSMLGPGLVMGGAAIGGGEWLAGPAVTAKYGGSLLWVAFLSILIQVLYNIEISRYTLYSGEPIFTGKFRLPPHPMFWLGLYLAFDWGSVAPYLAVNAAVPLETLMMGQVLDYETNANHWWMHKFVATGIYLLTLVPLIFGGKIYNSLKAVMSFKLVVVIGFLLVLSIFFSHPSSWLEIVSGFVKFGTVPVVKGEDLNGNGQLDLGEDFDKDGVLDVNEFLPVTLDTNNDGQPDAYEKDADGKEIRFEDVDGDGKPDGTNTENVFIELFTRGRLPEVDLSLIAFITGLAAIAGNGGLTNTPISNFTRDQGWGMGSHVGAIPSVVGGHGITLSHVGCVFEVNEESLPRWRRWYRHVVRDQLCVWLVACLIGVSLPSILSVEFLQRGTEASDWNAAAMTAGGVRDAVTSPPPGVLATETGLSRWLSGPTLGQWFWVGTLFCGFLVMFTSNITTMDGFVRRWVDVTWTASGSLRKLDTGAIGRVYFIVLCVYAVCGLSILWLVDKPGYVFKLSTTGYNLAFAFSAWHTVFVNSTLLPKPLRPHWLIRVGLILGGCCFFFMFVMAALKLAGVIR